MGGVERWRLRVEGRVQGVGYRDRVRRAAGRWRLVGEVWNEADGSVTVEAQGTPEALIGFETEIGLALGPSRPERVTRVARLPPVDGDLGFSIRM